MRRTEESFDCTDFRISDRSLTYHQTLFSKVDKNEYYLSCQENLHPSESFQNLGQAQHFYPKIPLTTKKVGKG